MMYLVPVSRRHVSDRKPYKTQEALSVLLNPNNSLLLSKYHLASLTSAIPYNRQVMVTHALLLVIL